MRVFYSFVSYKALGRASDGISVIGAMAEGEKSFRGIATGTWKNPSTKKTETYVCPVWSE